MDDRVARFLEQSQLNYLKPLFALQKITFEQLPRIGPMWIEQNVQEELGAEILKNALNDLRDQIRQGRIRLNRNRIGNENEEGQRDINNRNQSIWCDPICLLLMFVLVLGIISVGTYVVLTDSDLDAELKEADI